MLLSILEGGGFAWTFFINRDAFAQGSAPWVGLLRVLPYLLAALAIGAVVLTVLAWRCKYWHVTGQVHYTLVTAAALAQAWYLYNCNLL